MVRKGLYVVVALACSVFLGVHSQAANPLVTEAQFNGFCIAYFNAVIEPEMPKALGSKSTVVKGGDWQYISETSAVVAGETNLPAKSYIEYGPKPNYYIYVTPLTLRPTFVHVHYMKNLQPGATYYFRLVTIDEWGRVGRSEMRNFTTKTPANVVRVPEMVAGPPYVLDKKGATYVVTKDLRCPSTAFNIVADGVTLDLGGRTVTYNDKAGAADQGASERLYGPFASKNPCGIRGASGKRGIKVVNGTIQQGNGRGTAKPSGYNPIYLYKPAAPEIAGMTVIYSGSQVNGVIVRDATQGATVHHNVINDRGTELYNRHIAVDAIAFDVASAGQGPSKCHHNLILRTRHRGIKASPKCEIYGNAIYIDSYATSSYGIMYEGGRAPAGLSIHHNKIFGTGFHPVGIGSGQGWSDVQVFANYVQMQGTTQTWRWKGGEGGGDKDAAGKTGIYPVNGIRLLKPKENVQHYDNTVVVKGAGQNCWMRGLWLMPHQGVGKNVTFRNNRVKVTAIGPFPKGCAVAASGTGTQAPKPTVVLEGNRIESNLLNIQLGDLNGAGGPYTFSRNTIVKSGYDRRYKTMRVGWPGSRQQTYDHEFVDNTFEGGAGYDKVSFDGAGSRLEFREMWAVNIETVPGATVSIKNKSNRRIVRRNADQSGKLSLTLTQTVRTAKKSVVLTPHTIEVTKGGKKSSKVVTIDRSQTIVIKP